MSPTQTADVIVIGSGAGGAPVAWALAQAGARVVVLEKGPYYALNELTHDEVGITRRNFFVPYVEDDPHTICENGAVTAEPTREGWISLNVGGGTMHMAGFSYRLHAEDFDLQTRTGGIAGADLADWPITLADLQPHYDMAEILLGVSGLAASNPYEVRTREYPLPPILAHPAAELVDQGCRKCGMTSYPTARMILSEPYGARPPCTYCGLCVSYGCETGAKSSTYATFVPRAIATGRCEVRPSCFATRILVDSEDRAAGVEYVDAAGVPRAVRGRTVVLAASAIESARLLLLSATGRFPRGLANQSGLVGKNLTFSTFAKSTAVMDRAEVAQKVGSADMDLPFLQRSAQDDYWLAKATSSSPKGGTYNFLIHNSSPINAASRLAQDSGYTLYGEALKQRLHAYFHDELWLECEIFGEFLPSAKTFVDLDPNVTDRWGLPVARISLEHHPADTQTSHYLLQRTREVFAAMPIAPKEILTAAVGGTSYHIQQGTCRFGRDPEHSVLDINCQSHDVPGLYVTDGSFMPTSGGVPSTLTIMANSLRVAQAILHK